MSLDLLRQGKVGTNLILLPACVFISQPSSALLGSICDVFWDQPWCGTQLPAPTAQESCAGLSLHRGCTSIVGEAAAEPGAITTCLGRLKNPSQQTPKAFAEGETLQSSVISAWEAQTPERGTPGRGAALGSHSPCGSAPVVGSAFPSALPLPHLRVCRPSLQGLHVVFSSTGS